MPFWIGFACTYLVWAVGMTAYESRLPEGALRAWWREAPTVGGHRISDLAVLIVAIVVGVIAQIAV